MTDKEQKKAAKELQRIGKTKDRRKVILRLIGISS